MGIPFEIDAEWEGTVPKVKRGKLQTLLNLFMFKCNPKRSLRSINVVIQVSSVAKSVVETGVARHVSDPNLIKKHASS